MPMTVRAGPVSVNSNKYFETVHQPMVVIDASKELGAFSLRYFLIFYVCLLSIRVCSDRNSRRLRPPCGSHAFITRVSCRVRGSEIRVS